MVRPDDDDNPTTSGDRRALWRCVRVMMMRGVVGVMVLLVMSGD